MRTLSPQADANGNVSDACSGGGVGFRLLPVSGGAAFPVTVALDKALSGPGVFTVDDASVFKLPAGFGQLDIRGAAPSSKWRVLALDDIAEDITAASVPATSSALVLLSDFTVPTTLGGGSFTPANNSAYFVDWANKALAPNADGPTGPWYLHPNYYKYAFDLSAYPGCLAIIEARASTAGGGGTAGFAMYIVGLGGVDPVPSTAAPNSAATGAVGGSGQIGSQLFGTNGGLAFPGQIGSSYHGWAGTSAFSTNANNVNAGQGLQHSGPHFPACIFGLVTGGDSSTNWYAIRCRLFGRRGFGT